VAGLSASKDQLTLVARSSWQEQLRDAIRTPAALAAALDLSVDALSFNSEADGDFPLLVPRAFAARMRRGDLSDPLLKQVLPIDAERTHVPGFGTDPLGELALDTRTEGVLQKYRGRALLIATGHCAVNCRYCFRRHFPYGDSAASQRERRARIARLAVDPDLSELILSGGDPLLLGDREIGDIADTVSGSESLHTLRLHSRLPIVIPDRVTDELLQALQRPKLRAVMVLHSNHPQEIDSATAEAIGRLKGAGVTVLNQAVLLAGVNDDSEVLAELSDRLFAAGALPYYLHLLDPVAGAAHFAVPKERARRIVGEVAARQPGYLVPRLAEEVPGADSKREIAPEYPR
jgi:EF-P beta-lysylation protein EpmB